MLGENSLHFCQMPMIEYISEHEGCSQQQIADGLRVTPASVALSVKRLCKAGLIIKKADADNMRCNKVFITEHCRSEMQSAKAELDKADAKTFAGFSHEELNTLDEYVSRILRNLCGLEPDGIPPRLLYSEDNSENGE